jgi:predicted nucleic acid-binding protein
VKVVVDTSVLIDHLRGDARAIATLVDAVERGDELWSVTVVRTEVLAGMRPVERGATMSLFGAIRWHDVTIELADRAGELARAWMRSHPGVDTVDYLLAAAVEDLGASLLTRNVKHFPMMPLLKSPY